MKYKIEYECRTNGNIYQDIFEFQSRDNNPPGNFDSDVIETAMQMSEKFMKIGVGGIRILNITPTSK